MSALPHGFSGCRCASKLNESHFSLWQDNCKYCCSAIPACEAGLSAHAALQEMQ